MAFLEAENYVISEAIFLAKKIRTMKESSSASELAVQYFVNGSFARDSWRLVELVEILVDPAVTSDWVKLALPAWAGSQPARIDGDGQ